MSAAHGAPPAAKGTGSLPQWPWRRGQDQNSGGERRHSEAPRRHQGSVKGLVEAPGGQGRSGGGLEGLQATPGRGAPGLRRPTCSRSWAMSLISLFRRASSWACGRTMVGSGSGPGPRPPHHCQVGSRSGGRAGGPRSQQLSGVLPLGTRSPSQETLSTRHSPSVITRCQLLPHTPAAREGSRQGRPRSGPQQESAPRPGRCTPNPPGPSALSTHCTGPAAVTL